MWRLEHQTLRYHLLNIHATIEWLEKPTIKFSFQQSSLLLPRVVNVKQFEQLDRHLTAFKDIISPLDRQDRAYHLRKQRILDIRQEAPAIPVQLIPHQLGRCVEKLGLWSTYMTRYRLAHV